MFTFSKSEFNEKNVRKTTELIVISDKHIRSQSFSEFSFGIELVKKILFFVPTKIRKK